jgi:cellulose synthase operon protein C
MLVWRSCPRGRRGAALVVVLLASAPLLALAGAWDDIAEQKRAELGQQGDRPRAIAALAALAQIEDFLPPGRMAQVLREFVADKHGRRVDPLVHAQASYLLSLEEDDAGSFGEAATRRGTLGFVGDAWVLGPFDAQGRSGLARVFPVEESAGAVDPRPSKAYAGKDHEVFWRRADGRAFVQGALFLDALLRPDSDAVAYVLCYVHSKRDQWAALRIGSAGPVKAWLAGKPVWSNDVVRPAWPDQDTAPVHLRQGANLLLLKTVIVRGSWRVFLRVTDGDGRAIPGLSIGADVPARVAKAGDSPGRPGQVRDLGKLLRKSAERATGAAAARAWLDDALYLSLVVPADNELRAVEAAANRSLAASGNKSSAEAAEALLLLGSFAREEDDRRAALERAVPMFASAERRAVAMAAVARLWRSQHRDEAAIAEWSKAATLDKGCVPAQLALAREEERVGMAATALARIEALPEQTRALPLVLDVRADLLSSLGRRKEAELQRRALLDIRRSDFRILRALWSAASARGDVSWAAEYYAEATRLRPDLTNLVVDQASLLEGKGDSTGARLLLEIAVKRLPDDAGLHEELGRLEARTGRIDAALAAMRQSLRLRPQNPGLRRYMDALASARSAKRESRSVDDLATSHAADGEALAREALLSPAPADDASAEVLLDRTVVRVHPNGLAERFVQRIVHARTLRAARDGRETWVRFEPGRQEVEIRKARILRRGPNQDIEVSEATGRDERDLSEPWYGLYYDTRAAVVAFENLRAGDVVEVQYTVADVGHRNDLADYFGDFEMIADVLPTRRWDYTLIAPATRVFYFNQARFAGLATRTETRGSEIHYSFTARDVPRVESEPAMPGFAEVAPYLHVSTYRSWDDVGRWYWNLVADQMQDDGALKKAAQRAAGLASTLDKVKAVHRLVLESTRYVGLEFGIHGYKPYQATQVWERGFGDCKDKATLLLTLLRSLNIDAELVLLRTRRGGRIDEAPASLAVFDHAITYVPALDLYLDGTAEFSGLHELPAEDQDVMALRVSARGSKLVRTPIFPSEKNRALRTWQVDLHGDGSARITEVIEISGQAAHEWREHYQTEGEQRERYAKAWNGRYAGAQIESLAMEVRDRNRPVMVRAVVTVPQLGQRRDSGELHLPTSSRDADLTSTYARLGQRRWPLVLGYPWRHEESLDFRLPKGARIVRQPSARKIASDFGEFTLATQATQDGIAIRTVFIVNRSRIEPEGYVAFRAFLRDADAALAERVVIDLGGGR